MLFFAFFFHVTAFKSQELTTTKHPWPTKPSTSSPPHQADHPIVFPFIADHHSLPLDPADRQATFLATSSKPKQGPCIHGLATQRLGLDQVDWHASMSAGRSAFAIPEGGGIFEGGLGMG